MKSVKSMQQNLFLNNNLKIYLRFIPLKISNLKFIFYKCSFYIFIHATILQAFSSM